MILCSLVAFTASSSRADDENDVPPVRYPKLADAGPTREAFVPKGWKIEQTLEPDFDADGRVDALLVLRMNAKRNVISAKPESFASDLDSNPRMLVGLLAIDGGYRRLFDDHKLIPRWDNPMLEDPLQKVRAAPRGFSVKLEHFANAGTWWVADATLRFRFEGGCMRLIGFDRCDQSRSTGEVIDVSTNYLTSERICAHYVIEAPQTKPKKQKTAVRTSAPICIDAVGDGLSFLSEPPPGACPELELASDD